MIISKHIHSCLLVKEADRTILIDPGNFTYDEKGLTVDALHKLDYILITHEHPDHMYIPFIKELLMKFPKAQIITNTSAVNVLKFGGIPASSEQTKDIIYTTVPHEHVLGVEVPENTQFTIANKLTHPGDSLQFQVDVPVLALPVQGPWCSFTQAAEYALSVNPKIVIPIHDWHWNDAAREGFYQRLATYFGEYGIDFKPLTTGEEVTL